MTVHDISVIIPYYNENKTIKKTLDLISSQTISPKEVIFIDSYSQDNTSEIIMSWIENNQCNHLTKYKNIQGAFNAPGGSKNIGIKNASAEWIAFMDCGLIFPCDWLQAQWEKIIVSNNRIIFGCCYLEGENIWDIAAVSQTYGFKRKRPCVPSTLVKKDIFYKTGYFLENRRAGYDAEWQLKIRDMDINRMFNETVIVKYNGVNYGDNIKNIFMKALLYALPTVGLKYYKMPYYYIALIFICSTIMIYFTNTLYLFISLYFILRGYLIPIIKSKGISMFVKYPIMLIVIPIVGLIIDIAKIIGILWGMKKYHIKM